MTTVIHRGHGRLNIPVPPRCLTVFHGAALCFVLHHAPLEHHVFLTRFADLTIKNHPSKTAVRNTDAQFRSL